jgi:hypothetical protein
MVNVYSINHQITVMTTMLAQLILVAHLLDVSTPLPTAMITTNVLMTPAILLVDVLTLRRTAMMTMLALMMIVTLLLDV